MLGMGQLLCGTLTRPEDSRTATLGGAKAVSAAETDSSGIGQDGVGIQPCLSPSIRRDTQFFLPVCNWWAQGFLRRRQMGPSFPVAGCSGAGTHSRDCPQCLDWANGDLPGREAGQDKAVGSEMGVIQTVSPQGSAAPAGGNPA